MQDVNKIWSSVGSAGTVNPADASKVFLSGSVVQLGQGVVTKPAEKGEGIGFPLTQAVVRYDVTAVDGVADPNRINYALKVFGRKGSGQIQARLVQVAIPPANTASPVNESTLIQFQRKNTFPQFSVEQALGPDTELNFVNNSYYVELTLSGHAIGPVLEPPAVAAIQLELTVP